MSNVESSAPERTFAPPQRAAEQAASVLERQGDAKAKVARAFLIQLCVAEIQLSRHVAGWLRGAARQLAAADMPELSAECIRLAAETWEQREQLLALAYRLVARRNRGLGRRRINVGQMLDEPPSKAMAGFIALNEALGDGPPGAVLASVADVEQLLTGTVPLALDLGGFAPAHDDLAEVGELYEARESRAAALARLVAELGAAEPARRPALRELGQRAVEAFTKITRESAELGQQLDGWRRSTAS